MPDLHQTRAHAALRLAPLLVGAILIGVGAAQAGNADDPAPVNAAAATVSNQPAADGDPSVPNESATEAQKLLCMWRNKGVTGFCAVEPEAQVGTACSCRAIIEHKVRKFTGKTIVSR